MSQVDRSFIGEGVIYARAYQSQDPLIDIGNADSFSLAFTSDRKTLPNYRGGGGNRNVNEKITGVTCAIGMYDITAENLARVTRSTTAAIPTTAIVDELQVCGGVIGELVPFKYLPNLVETIAVVTAADLPLIAGTDYRVTAHGLIVLSTDVTAAGVKVSYTPRAATAIQLLNGAQVELELYISGLNDAQSGEPFSLRPRRVKFGLLSALSVFGTEYLKLEGSAELLADDMVSDSGISKFCEMQLVDKAV